ncbi:MAG: arsenate-mycothiol transferase ArsC [Gammaproteobacteria bacterium]
MVMKKSVLFLCTGNSARSLIAEALLKKQASHYFDVFNASTSPEGIDPRTLEVLERFNIPTQGLRSKSVSEFNEYFEITHDICIFDLFDRILETDTLCRAALAPSSK